MISNAFSQIANLTFHKHRTIKLQLLLAVLALGCTVAWCYERADAVAYNWTNGAGGEWTTDGNWSASGDPDGNDDTATFGNLGGGYIATLSSPRTIGGLNISGGEPTLTLSSTLTIDGGTSTISGGTINGAGTLRLTNTPTIDWTGGSLGGTATIQLPTLQSATINNTPGTFAVGSGQSIRLGDVANGTPTFTDLTFSNGFSNSGEIRLGMEQPGDKFGRFRMFITAGTLTNDSSGVINMHARSATEPSATWNHREIQSNIQNDGLIRSYGSTSLLGAAGKTFVNTGTLSTDYSTYSTSARIPAITITGTSFTNTGTIDAGVNHGGKGGGIITINSTTVDLNSGSTITGPGTVILGGDTNNVNLGTSISGLSTLGFGRPGATSVVNWNIADLTDPMTFQIQSSAAVTINRTGDWNLPANQVLWLDAKGSPGSPMGLTMAENLNNSGTVRMGSNLATDNYARQTISLTGGKTFTNLAGALVEMFPRSAIEPSDTWNQRYIDANVVNDGTMDVYASNGRLGTTGTNDFNNGAINVDSSIFTTGGRARIQVAGDTFTNSSTGTIDLDNGILWSNTPTFNYDGGSITSNAGSEIWIGSTSIDTNFIFNGGAEITDPVTYRIMPDSNNTITRTSTWNITNGQELKIDKYAASGTTGFTINQDISNSGVFNLGSSVPTAFEAINQRMQFTSTNSIFTNNADGVVNMYPACASCGGNTTNDNPWSVRRIEGEVINNGNINVYTRFGNIGKAGMDHVNNGFITVDKSYYELGPSGFIPELIVTGSSFLNGSAGVISGNGVFDVTGTTFNNAGTLSPGLSAGLLTIEGDINFQSGGTIYIEVVGENGVAGVDYDQLIVTGNVNGLTTADLVVDISSSSLLLVDDVLTILTSDNDLSGVEFDSISFVGGNFLYDIEYGDGFIQLSNIESFIPEPSSGILLFIGLIALRRRNRRKA